MLTLKAQELIEKLVALGCKCYNIENEENDCIKVVLPKSVHFCYSPSGSEVVQTPNDYEIHVLTDELDKEKPVILSSYSETTIRQCEKEQVKEEEEGEQEQEEYFVVEGGELAQLSDYVSEAMKRGFRPQGGVCAVQVNTRRFYLQAMVGVEREEQ